jgi:transcriptional regulator GlxA family with amidase domain
LSDVIGNISAITVSGGFQADQDPHWVVALVHPPQSTFELAIAAEIFGLGRPNLPLRYRFQVCAEHTGPVRTQAGYDIAVTAGLSAMEMADTIVVPRLAIAGRAGTRRRHRCPALRPWPRGTEGSLAPVLDWAAGRLREPITVQDMAAQARLSPRTFARHFHQQVGDSPGRWVLAQRINAARTLLEETDLPVESVATRVGLSSAINLRRHFHRHLRTTPAAYRRAFRRFP